MPIIRRPILAPVMLLLATLAASCTRSSPTKGYQVVELTADDVISLYEVPVDQKPARKFEWNFERPRYLQAVLERRDSRNEPWKVTNTFESNGPWDRGSFAYLIDQINREPLQDKEWHLILVTRIGGSASKMNHLQQSSWSGSRLSLPMPGIDLETESSGTDPDKVLLLTSGPRSYRLRLESSDRAFPKH
jgi:hypothetical protein